MKGHIGFPCRACLAPGYPTNLHQTATYDVLSGFSGTLAWDPPVDTGGGAVVEYLVELATSPAATSWTTVATTGGEDRTAYISWCQEGGIVRVSARNRCGWGPPAQFSSWVFLGASAKLFAGSATFMPPCWAESMKVWCIGRGSNAGNGGGMAWKTWHRVPGTSWQQATVTVRNAVGNGLPDPLASVTYDGSTVTGYGAVGISVGQYAGGDGGAYGNPGGTGYFSYFGTDYASITYPFSGAVQYSGNYSYTGGIGGDPGNTPLPVSPCRRHPARDRAGLLNAVSLLGMRVTEECVTEAAFGSGGVTFSMSTYGGTVDVFFEPSAYGAGGFNDTHPAGNGCVIVQFS